MQDKWKDIYPEDTKEIPEYLFIAKLNEPGPPQIDPIEHDHWKWCKYEEAMDLLTWDDNKSALEFVHKFLGDDLIKEKK
jgi:hypothetical protein